MSAMFSRRAALAGAVVALALAAAPAGAGQAEIFAGPGNLAINGHDPVAYFKEGKPVAGVDAYSFEWKGANWRFANAENLRAFVASPEKYAPQYGGYCAYAVSRGAIAPTDPTAFTVVDGKLYLNYSREVRAIWVKDIAGNLAKANANWPGVLN